MDKEYLKILEEAHRTGGAVNIIFKKSNIIPDSIGVITEILNPYNEDEPWIELFDGEEGLRYNCQSIKKVEAKSIKDLLCMFKKKIAKVKIFLDNV